MDSWDWATNEKFFAVTLGWDWVPNEKFFDANLGWDSVLDVLVLNGWDSTRIEKVFAVALGWDLVPWAGTDMNVFIMDGRARAPDGSFGFVHRVGKRMANKKATMRDQISDRIDSNSIGTVRCSRRYSGSGVE